MSEQPLNGHARPGAAGQIDEAALLEQLSITDRLVLETSTVPWHELQRLFAGGRVIAVAPELDLIEVAAQLHEDNKTQFEAWIAANQVGPVKDAQALRWYEANTLLWAVVVSPWVLVQDRD